MLTACSHGDEYDYGRAPLAGNFFELRQALESCGADPNALVTGQLRSVLRIQTILNPTVWRVAIETSALANLVLTLTWPRLAPGQQGSYRPLLVVACTLVCLDVCPRLF